MKTAEAITTALEAAANSAGEPMTERRFLREIVAHFANSGALSGALIATPSLVRDVEHLERLHARFRSDLQGVVDGTISAADRRRIYRAADRMLMAPQTGENGEVRFHYLPEGIEAVTAHALRLLLDPSRPEFGEDLRQCQWHECNHIKDARNLPHVRKFFFVSERREVSAQTTGRSPERYCCEEHMRAAHRERATAATIKRRKELRELKLAKAKSSKHKATTRR